MREKRKKIPPKELHALLGAKTYAEIGKIYGWSPVSVRKMAMDYGCILPKRGRNSTSRMKGKAHPFREQFT